jgi:hypothetical protein
MSRRAIPQSLTLELVPELIDSRESHCHLGVRLAKEERLKVRVLAATVSVLTPLLTGCGDSTGPGPRLAWSMVASPSTDPLTGISGTSSSDIWIVGWNGTVLHFDGAAWSRVATGTGQDPIAVWAGSPTDVWIVGTDGIVADALGNPTIQHYDGMHWSIVASPSHGVLTSIWGSSASDIWAVSHTGEIAHYDGVNWSSIQSPSTERLLTVWGTSASDVWAGGYRAILHYDGTNWSTSSSLSDMAYAMWGTSRSDVWAGTDSGLLHYNGAAWSSVPSGFGLPPNPFRGRGVPYTIWGTSRLNVWVGGQSPAISNGTCCGKIEHYSGTIWSDASLDPTAPIVSAIWGSSASDVWAVTTNGILHGTPVQ